MKIGFMQGRLSPLVNGKIQAFPSAHWRDEFPAPEALGIQLMEWTLDQEDLDTNPLLTESGRREIVALQERHRVGIPSCTGDCFMQAPFYKASGGERARLVDQLERVAEACARLGMRYLLIPLLDNGTI